MRFSDVIGNSEAVEALRGMVDSNRIPHALLLSGPSGIGKMILARAFIAYLNCENPHDGDSCGVCPACRRIAALTDPDVHYIFPIRKLKSSGLVVSSDYIAEWKQFLDESPYMDYPRWLELMDAGNSQPQIAVEESADIIAAAALSAYADRFKVFLIWLPEKIGTEAANKILKVLEEPHEDTLFLCVSNDPASILPTIYSRLRRVEMRPPAATTIASALEKRGVAPHTAANFADLASGSLLRAFQLIGSDGETEEFAHHFQDAMRACYGRKAGIARAMAESIAGLGREKNLRLLDYFARQTRENFVANLCIPPLNRMTSTEAAFSSRFAPFINVANTEDILREIDTARRDISRNANAKLVWFDLFLHLMILLRKK